MISIIDYGLGNLKAFANIYKRLNIPFQLIKKPGELDNSTKIILPGVGAFDHAMNELNESGLRDKLDEMVLVKKIPVLGICVGLQMLGNTSEEGKMKGLGWIDAEIKKFDVLSIKQKPQLPHMGWNDVIVLRDNPLFHNLSENPVFYFLHSYYFNCEDSDHIVAKSNYGIDYACAVNRENIYGVQFHPEKSHHYGIQLLKNFAII